MIWSISYWVVRECIYQSVLHMIVMIFRWATDENEPRCFENFHIEFYLFSLHFTFLYGCSCNCGPCRRELNLEPTGCIIEHCRDSGFTNVHDYLVHLETGESADEIASRKVGRCWTNGGTPMPPLKDIVGDQDHLITLRIPSHGEVLQSISVSGTLEDMDIDPSSERAANEVNVTVGAKRKGMYFQVFYLGKLWHFWTLVHQT